MTIQVTRSGDFIQLDEHLERVRRLAADLENLKKGQDPDPAVIQGSPYIHQWVLDTRPVPCLRGYIDGHPNVRAGRMAVTSDLWVWAPDHGYARTLSRWYRLGAQGNAFEGSGRR